jgi:Mg/Co/Ni transporter MgtE
MMSEERLKRIEEYLESAAHRLDNHGELIAELRTAQIMAAQQIEATNQSLQLTNQTVRDFAILFQEFLLVVRDMQAEVRGLQLENRRILDHLFGTGEEPAT